LAASTAVGLEVMAELMDAESATSQAPKANTTRRTATRHGADDGTVTLGGRRLPIRRPRVRSVGEDTHKIPLASYATFSSTDLLADHIVAGMLAGLSTRRYEAGLEPVGERVTEQAKGTSKSAVSRRFVGATAERLAELLPAGWTTGGE
jgi:putative transposase